MTMNRPLVWLGGCFAGGIFLQSIFPLSFTVLAALSMLFLCVSVLILKRQGEAVFFLLLLTVSCGGSWLCLAEKEHVTNLGGVAGGKVTLQGTIVSQPLMQSGKLVCDVKVDRIQTKSRAWQRVPSEKVRVYVFQEENVEEHLAGQKTEDLNYGDVLIASGKLVQPKGKRNPGDFDYRQYLKYRGIYHLFYIYPNEKVAVKSSGQGNPVMGMAYDVRKFFSEITREHLFQRQSGLLLGMLFGEQGGVFEEDLEVFRDTGIAHALSVSGFHVGLVLLLVLGFCRIIRAGRRGTLFAAIAALCAYCLLSAFTVTVVRATIMGILGLLAYNLDREKNIFIALAASALIILIWNPYFLFDPGFQLSFTAVWAIAYLEPWLRELLPDCLYQQGALLTVPLAAQLGTMPIIAYHFNILSLLAIAANILLLPLMSGIVIIGLCAFVLSPVSVLAAGALLHTTGVLIDLLIYSGRWIAALPGTVRYVATPPLLLQGVYFAVLIAAKESWERKSVFYPGEAFPRSSHVFPKVILGFAAAAVFFYASLQWTGDDVLRLFFLDVGQGDAILVQSPSGRTALVDGGGMPEYMGQGYDPGKDTVLPFLHRRGINKLDLLINTHPDEDHLDGLEDVLQEMPVSRIITPPARQWQDKYAGFLETAREKGVPHSELTGGARIRLDEEVLINVMGPEKAGEFESSNDSSLVLEVCHGKNKFLLLGDLESQGIASLMKSVSDLDCFLLKIPHHGSGGSFDKNLYQKTDPEIVVISVGENNPFGHPSKEVVAYWEEAEVPVYRTDLNGGIVVESDGQACFVECVQ